MTAALPLRVLPPMFNRYDVGMTFGRMSTAPFARIPGSGQRMRTDVSSTLFLTPPEDYDGGELVVHDTYGTHTVETSGGAHGGLSGDQHAQRHTRDAGAAGGRRSSGRSPWSRTIGSGTCSTNSTCRS